MNFQLVSTRSLLAAFLLVAIPAAADRVTFLGPDGGAVNAVVTAPSIPGLAFAATETAGVFKSVNGGASWQPARSGLPAEPIGHLAGSRDGRTLYAATRGAFFASEDGGKSWERRTLARSGGYTINALAISPTAPRTLYMTFNDSSFSFFGAAFKSTDGGSSWRQLDTAVSGELAQNFVAMAVAPSHPATVYLVSYGSAEILRSADGGESWALGGAAGFAGQDARLAVDPRDARHLYLLREGALTESRDGGETWSPSVQVDTTDFGLKPAAGLVVDPTAPATLYAAYSVFTGGQVWYGGGRSRLAGRIARSTDGGASWSRVAEADTLRALAIDGRSGLYAGADRIGVLKSDDRGETWKRRNRGLAAAPVCEVLPDSSTRGVLYIAAGLCGPNAGAWPPYHNNDLGVLKRSSEGTWANLNQGLRSPGFVLEPYRLVADPRGPGRLYAATSQGLFTSRAGGGRWTRTEGRLPTLLDAVQDVAVDPDDPQRLYAAGFKLGYPICGGFCPLLPQFYAVRSTDGGRSWRKLPLNLGFSDYEGSFDIEVDPQDSNTLYIAHSALHKSTDRGATWKRLAVKPAGQLQEGFVHRLAIDPRAPQTIYATASLLAQSHIIKSTDGGESWSLAMRGIPAPGVNDLALDPSTPGKLYAATEWGAFESDDAGESWHPLSDLLPRRHVLSIRVDPFDPATLYVATEREGGLFALTRTAR